jgi:Domain of unknown function (DUF1906)
MILTGPGLTVPGKELLVLKGIDFSFGGGLTTSQIKGAGCSFVCRYLSGGGSKDIDSTELADYKAAGIPVIFVWETTGTDMVSEAAGVNDAKAAQAELGKLAAALRDTSIASAPVFFAADEASEPDMPDYVRGAASVLGKSRTGIYGGYSSVHAAFDGGLVSYGWQTYAWSSGEWENRALLRQVQNNVKLGPATVDIDEAAYWSSSKVLGLGDDFGQWPRPSADPPPSQGPYRHVIPDGNKLSLQDIANSRGEDVPGFMAYQESLTPGTLSPEHYQMLLDYQKLENDAVAAGLPRPPIMAGVIYYTKNP